MTVTDATSREDIRERLVALTRDLILVPSIPSRPDDRRQCYEQIKNHLEYLEHIEVREFEYNGVPSLVAAPPGCYHPDVLLCGHLDVITHPDIALYRSEIKDGRIIGPGAGDMKGAVAVLLEVFRTIHARRPDASLGIVITSDEETGGEAGIGYLVNEIGLRCGRAMIPDGGALEEVTVEEKGILHLKIVCEGHSAHAARPWLGDNPLERLMDGLTRLRARFADLVEQGHHWYPTCAVTIMETENQTINRIPVNATAVLDIRFPPPFTVASILELIKDNIGCEAVVEPVISAEPTHLSPDARYQAIIEEITGCSVSLTRDDGGSDARYFAAQGIPVLMSRPIVGNLHAEDEWIDIDSMVDLYHIYERYLSETL